MSYEHRSNVKQNSFLSPFRIVGFLILFLTILYFALPNFLPYIFSGVAKPFWDTEKNIKGDDILIPTRLTDALIADLQRENTLLKEIMGRSISSSTLVAYILKKPPFSAYDIFIIDVGSRNGVQIGDKVYAMGNVLLGEIDEVSMGTSKVRLYSSYGEKYEVLIGENNIQATANGRGGGFFDVVLPRDVAIKENDIVTVPSINSSVFGVVDRIVEDVARSFSTIYFSQPINIYEQKFVEIKMD